MQICKELIHSVTKTCAEIHYLKDYDFSLVPNLSLKWQVIKLYYNDLQSCVPFHRPNRLNNFSFLTLFGRSLLTPPRRAFFGLLLVTGHSCLSAARCRRCISQEVHGLTSAAPLFANQDEDLLSADVQLDAALMTWIYLLYTVADTDKNKTLTMIECLHTQNDTQVTDVFLLLSDNLAVGSVSLILVFLPASVTNKNSSAVWEHSKTLLPNILELFSTCFQKPPTSFFCELFLSHTHQRHSPPLHHSLPLSFPSSFFSNLSPCLPLIWLVQRKDNHPRQMLPLRLL